MAEEGPGQDPFAALITGNCRSSSSQEELLSHSKFAREDEVFPDDDTSPVVEDSGVSRRNLDGADESRGIFGGELAAGGGDCAEAKKLGFGGKRKGKASGTKLERGEREIEPQLKKLKVSPTVHCSGKMVIEGGDDGEEVVVFSGDLKVEKVRDLRSVVPESVGCTEDLDSEGGGDDVRVEGESGARKKLEFELDTEVINVEEEEEIGVEIREIDHVDKEFGDHGERSGKVEGDEKQGRGTSTGEEEEKGITRRRKRELPRSMFGLVWGEGTGDGNLDRKRDEDGGSKEGEEEAICGEERGDANENVVVSNDDVEGSLKEASVDGKTKGGEEEAIKCILDVLRMVLSEKSSKDDGEVDVFETAKRRGMTFPRSRFLPEVEEDE